MPDTNSSGSGGTRIALPWPDKLLSPNARLHWAVKAKRVKVARNYAWGATLEVFGASPAFAPGGVNITTTFCPPDRRRRDLDNLIASMKASNDGIADALGVDDSRFISTYSMGQPVKGGAVFVTIRGTAA